MTKRNVWCNNYRVRPGYMSDSDSDPGRASDVDDDAVAKPDTSDAHIMREMDLSGRHETVEYHPNPWSIARINAASRSSLAKPTTGPVQSLPEPQSKPIIDAFKKQAKRGPRDGQPIVRDVSNPEDHSIADKSCATTCGSPPAKKSHHSCERTTSPAQLRAYTGLLGPPFPAHKPQAGPAVHVVKTLKKEKSTHISTFSDRSIQSSHVQSKPRRIIGTRQAARSSPVRPVASRSTPDVLHAIRDRPTLHHSSPGPRLHVPVPTAHIMRQPLPPLVSAPACTKSQSAKISNDLSPASPPPRVPGNMDQGVVPSWLLDALDNGIYMSPPPLPLVSEPQQDATNPPHIGTPEPKHKRLTSLRSATPRKKPRASASASRPLAPVRPTVSTSRRCPAAYAFREDDDPDAEWSTLEGTKRRAVTSAKRAGKLGGVRQSGCFRLPLPGLAPRTPARAPEAKQRVIAYLPPPMVSIKHGNESMANVDPPTAKHAHVASEEQEEAEEIEIRMMDSDVTLVNEDEGEEHVAGIDVDDVCMRYHTARACMKAESHMRRALGCIVELRV